MRWGILLIAIFMACSGSASAQSPEATQAMRRWDDANGRCRGGSGDNPATMKACDERESLYQAAVRLGWCYGRANEYGYQNRWHRCGPGSIR